MAGPYPPEYGAGPVGPQMYPTRVRNGFLRSQSGTLSGERPIAVSGHAAAAGAVSEEAALATDRRRAAGGRRGRCDRGAIVFATAAATTIGDPAR